MGRRVWQLLASVFALILVLALLTIVTPNVHALVPGVNELISVDSNGNLPNNVSYSSGNSVSGDGRYIAFESEASNLVPNDTNGFPDVFVRDRINGTTTRVSVSSSGTQANGSSFDPAMSNDGRYVVFGSSADNLGATVTSNSDHVYLHDMLTGTTTVVDTAADGTVGNSVIDYMDVSADGRYVVFDSSSSNLVSGINPIGVGSQIFLKDMMTGSIKALSVNASGSEGNHSSILPKISCDGSVVTFRSQANNLVANDTNGATNIFVDVLSDNTNHFTNITISGNGYSEEPNISCDGNYIVYRTSANNLAPTLPASTSVLEYNRLTSTTSVVSANGSGVPGAGQNLRPSVSKDGRYVTFLSSAASDLDPSRSYYGNGDVLNTFLRDTLLGTTQVLSINLAGQGAGGSNDWPTISADGSVVSYDSVRYQASNPLGGLVANDTNGYQNIYASETGIQNVPSAPTNLAIPTPTQNPVLSWTASSGADSYNIYRGGTKIGLSSTNSFTDNAAPEGNTNYYVTAVNASGESSPSNSVNVVVDRTPPSLGTPTWTTNPMSTTLSTTVTVPVTDSLSGVNKGEYFLGAADPGQGSGTAITLSSGNLSASFSNMAAGIYTINFRAEDNTGNWSPVTTDYLVVYDSTKSSVDGHSPDVVPIFGTDVLPGLVQTGQKDKEHFAFTVKYKNGALDPASIVHFDYKTGTNCNDPNKATNCHSTALDSTSISWMVISGTNNSQATLQGIASLTVDGVTTTNPFRIIATDGTLLDPQTTDQFELQIFAPGANPNIAQPLYYINDPFAKGNIMIKS